MIFYHELVRGGADAQVTRDVEVGDSLLVPLVQEANDFVVLVDLFVSIVVGAKTVQVAICKLFKSRFHGSSQVGIGIFQVALTLMSGLGARVVVDLCTATATNSRFASCAGRGTASSSAASATATASFSRAGLMNSSVTHGDVAIQLWCVGWCVR